MPKGEFVEGTVRSTETSHVEETDTFESTVLDAVESLRPGALISEPCFDVTENDAEQPCTQLTEPRGSFSRSLNHSSGSINQIRAASTISDGVETIIIKTESVSVVSENEFSQETVTKTHTPRGSSLDQTELRRESIIHGESTTEPMGVADIVDGQFEVQCTSSYLPQDGTSVRHASTKIVLHEDLNETKSEKEELVPSEEETDYTLMPEWRNQRRQLFIFSNSGKPVYSRHGEEDKLVTLCGVMQALISVVNDTNNNQLWSFRASGMTISFLVRTPLVLVTVAKTGETDRQLIVYLNYAYEFIISVLTLPQLSRIFVRFPNFDLRRMLSGTEKILDRLVDWFDEDFGFLLGSVRCMPLAPSVRENVNSLLTHSCQKTSGLVFAVLIAKRQLISVTRLKKYVLHPSDIRLLINLVDASDSFKTAESWIPICLPKFDSGGFLHAYITYLRDSPVCLIYLGVDPDLFHSLAKNSANFISKLESSGNLDSILAAMASTALYTAQQSGVVELRHFVYKSTSAAQLTSPVVAHPYMDHEQRHILRGFYRYMHRKMHCPTRAAKIIVVTSNTEMLLGWVTGGFELYAVLEPSISKHQAVLAIEKLIKWIKKEENQLFILNSPVFS